MLIYCLCFHTSVHERLHQWDYCDSGIGEVAVWGATGRTAFCNKEWLPVKMAVISILLNLSAQAYLAFILQEGGVFWNPPGRFTAILSTSTVPAVFFYQPYFSKRMWSSDAAIFKEWLAWHDAVLASGRLDLVLRADEKTAFQHWKANV